MLSLASWWCRLFGYGSCRDLTGLDAVVVGGVAFVAAYVVLAFLWNVVRGATR